MKWGVRRSSEVRSVNKQYKKDLKNLKSERNKSLLKNRVGYDASNPIMGDAYSGLKYTKNKVAINKQFKQQKKDLQEKYEPEFKKAQDQAEKRLSTETRKISKGKKVAAGVLAGLGAATVAQLAVDVARNKDVYKAFIASIPAVLTKKL